MIPAPRLNSGFEIPLLGWAPTGWTARPAPRPWPRRSRPYRLLDTAAKYGNEWAVGEAIRRSGADRRDLFVTSKLRGADHGRAKTRAALAASLDRLPRWIWGRVRRWTPMPAWSSSVPQTLRHNN